MGSPGSGGERAHDGVDLDNGIREDGGQGDGGWRSSLKGYASEIRFLPIFHFY